MSTSARSAPGVNRSVTSTHPSTKQKIRMRENCSRRAWTSIIVKWLNPATEPDTSQSSTSSGRPGRGLRCTRFTGTPPVDIERRSVRRMSIPPRWARRRRAASRVARWRPSGATRRRRSARVSAFAERKSVCSAWRRTPVRAAASRPRISEPRRDVSACTMRRNSAIRARVWRRATSSANGLSAASGSRRPRRSARTRASSVSGRTVFSAW